MTIPLLSPARIPEGRHHLLIVNADDFGLTARTSEVILQLHEEGVVTSTSVLVTTPGFEAGARGLVEHATLGIGIHLCLIGPDPAVCPPRDIPTLVDRRGRLASSWHLLLPRLLLGRVDPGDIDRELSAQVERAIECGLRPDHLDSHQHLHLWPMIAPVVIGIAHRYGIPAIRCPQARSIKAERLPVNVMSTGLRHRIEAAGLRTTERFAGLDESGRAVAERFDRVVDRTPPGVTSFEFGVHPGDDDDPDRWRYPWPHRGTEEALGLARRGLRTHLENLGWRLGTFGDLVTSHRPGART